MNQEKQSLKIELSKEGKELLKFVKDVQDGKLSAFEITPMYETTLPMFDLQPAPLYYRWGKVV